MIDHTSTIEDNYLQVVSVFVVGVEVETEINDSLFKKEFLAIYS